VRAHDDARVYWNHANVPGDDDQARSGSAHPSAERTARELCVHRSSGKQGGGRRVRDRVPVIMTKLSDADFRDTVSSAARDRVLELSAVLEALRPNLDTADNKPVEALWLLVRAQFFAACEEYAKELERTQSLL